MRDQIINKISSVIVALNTVQVCGKNNLGNLAGSISVLENVRDELCGAKFEVVCQDKEQAGEGM
jgi:hypothetical protein